MSQIKTISQNKNSFAHNRLHPFDTHSKTLFSQYIFLNIGSLYSYNLFFLLHTLTDEREVKILFEIMEKRAESLKSTIVCSQREPNSWPSMILNDEVSADSIKGRATKHYTVVIKPQ